MHRRLDPPLRPVFSPTCRADGLPSTNRIQQAGDQTRQQRERSHTQRRIPPIRRDQFRLCNVERQRPRNNEQTSIDASSDTSTARSKSASAENRIPACRLRSRRLNHTFSPSQLSLRSSSNHTVIQCDDVLHMFLESANMADNEDLFELPRQILSQVVNYP